MKGGAARASGIAEQLAQNKVGEAWELEKMGKCLLAGSLFKG